MACSGGHCTNHGTGTTTCAGHRPQNSSVSPTVYAAGVGTIVTATKINELRSAITTEINRWQLHAGYAGVAVVTGTAIVQGQVIDETATLDLQDTGLGLVGHAGYPGTAPVGSSATADVSPALPDYDFTPGAPIYNSDYQLIINKYDTLRADCICNSDCSCNNVCACHNDCGCNYSDKRLKVEIYYC